MLTLTSPVETPLHRVPAGWKLLLLCLFTAVLFALVTPWALLAALAALAGLHLLCGRVFLRNAVLMLWPLWPFILVVAVWHIWTGSPQAGAIVILRLVAAVAGANLLTMTTRLSDMIGVIEWLAAPLRRFGLNPRVLAVAIALVIRFTPVFFFRAAQLTEAWRARSARRVGWRYVLPVTLLALDDADHVADALRARGGL
jgi:biotin transport system permease protein